VRSVRFFARTQPFSCGSRSRSPAASHFLEDEPIPVVLFVNCQVSVPADHGGSSIDTNTAGTDPRSRPTRKRSYGTSGRARPGKPTAEPFRRSSRNGAQHLATIDVYS